MVPRASKLKGMVNTWSTSFLQKLVLSDMTIPTVKLVASPFLDNVLAVEYVGSRVTCSPPPTDTDEDVLLLCDNITRLQDECVRDGYTRDGDEKYLIPEGEVCLFTSLRKGNINIIATESKDFFDKFMLATKVCKKLNVMKKIDRVTVFQAILYQKEG